MKLLGAFGYMGISRPKLSHTWILGPSEKGLDLGGTCSFQSQAFPKPEKWVYKSVNKFPYTCTYGHVCVYVHTHVESVYTVYVYTTVSGPARSSSLREAPKARAAATSQAPRASAPASDFGVSENQWP